MKAKAKKIYNFVIRKVNRIKRIVVDHPGPTVSIVMLIGFIAFLSIGIRTKTNALWSGLWINLAASAIVILVTINFINYLFERDKKNKWRDAKETAIEDVNQFKNMLISHVLSPLGFAINPNDSRIDPNNFSSSTDVVLVSLFDDVRGRNLVTILSGLDRAAWHNMSLNTKLIKVEFIEYFQLYQDIMPPELLGKFLKLHKAFKKFFNTLGMVYVTDILWSGQDESLRTLFINSLSDDLEAYFTALHNFKAALSKWK